MPGFRMTGVAVIVAALALAGCRSATVETVRDEPYGIAGDATPASLSLAQYQSAIVRAGVKRGWVFQQVASGHLQGTIDVRGKHEASVDVFFDTQKFTILYKDSRNLDYDPAKGTIHPNYNSWVRNLENDIRSEVQAARIT